MRLYEAIVENSKLDQLHKMLHKLFIDYDNSILKYKQTAFDNPSLDKDNMEDVQERVEQEDESKSALKNVITVLNKIQIVFERLNYSSSTSTADDVDEDNFISQLDRFSEQCLLLDEDFNRESFTAFFNDLSYLTSLSEIHFNNRFGELTENIEVSEKADDILEETDEYLENLPEIDTNEIK